MHLYNKKQNGFLKTMHQLKIDHEKEILSSQLEIQEQTFQYISREIHDNINLSLTLAKLNLNTLDFTNKRKLFSKINASVKLLSFSINDLNNIIYTINNSEINEDLTKRINNYFKNIKDNLER